MADPMTTTDTPESVDDESFDDIQLDRMGKLMDAIGAETEAARAELEQWKATAEAQAAEIARLSAALNDADRRAGAAERKLARAESVNRAHDSWIAKAKEQAGYEQVVSFDNVWDETLARATQAEAALAALRVEAQAMREALEKSRGYLWEIAHGQPEALPEDREAAIRALSVIDAALSTVATTPQADSEGGGHAA